MRIKNLWGVGGNSDKNNLVWSLKTYDRRSKKIYNSDCAFGIQGVNSTVSRNDL